MTNPEVMILVLDLSFFGKVFTTRLQDGLAVSCVVSDHYSHWSYHLSTVIATIIIAALFFVYPILPLQIKLGPLLQYICGSGAQMPITSPTHRHQSSNMCGKHKLSTFKLLEMFFFASVHYVIHVCVCVCVWYVCQRAANDPGSDVAIPRVSLSVSAAERASFHWSLVEGRRCSSAARQCVGARSLLSGCHGQRQQVLLLSNGRWSANVAQIVRTPGLLFILLNDVVGAFLTDSLRCWCGFQPRNTAVQWDICVCVCSCVVIYRLVQNCAISLCESKMVLLSCC